MKNLNQGPRPGSGNTPPGHPRPRYTGSTRPRPSRWEISFSSSSNKKDHAIDVDSGPNVMGVSTL